MNVLPINPDLNLFDTPFLDTEADIHEGLKTIVKRILKQKKPPRPSEKNLKNLSNYLEDSAMQVDNDLLESSLNYYEYDTQKLQSISQFLKKHQDLVALPDEGNVILKEKKIRDKAHESPYRGILAPSL